MKQFPICRFLVISTRRSWSRTLSIFALFVLFSGLALATSSKAGSLIVEVNGFQHERGKVVVKLFRQSDDLPKGRAFRRLSAKIKRRGARVDFSELAFGQYAIFVFHDENGNGIPDHNFIGIPTEPMGFSNDFKVSLFTGIPDFDDLKFVFRTPGTRMRIRVD